MKHHTGKVPGKPSPPSLRPLSAPPPLQVADLEARLLALRSGTQLVDDKEKARLQALYETNRVCVFLNVYFVLHIFRCFCFFFF